MSDADIFRRLRLLEAEVRRLRALEYKPLAGTWTPAFGGTAGNGTISYTRQVGSYLRVGTLVIAWCNSLLVDTVTAAPSGNLVLLGLPFTARTLTNATFAGTIGQYNALNLTAGCIDLTLRVSEQNAYADFIENFDNAGASALPGSALASGAFLTATLIYEAAG